MDNPTRVEYVRTAQAPTPGGHYSQATMGNGHVYISGQLPIDQDSNPRSDLVFEEQARLAIGNMLAILRETGAHPQHLLRVTAYIVGIENWPCFNAAYADLLPEVKPARTVVPVSELHHGCLIELDAIALLPTEPAMP